MKIKHTYVLFEYKNCTVKKRELTSSGRIVIEIHKSHCQFLHLSSTFADLIYNSHYGFVDEYSRSLEPRPPPSIIIILLTGRLQPTDESSKWITKFYQKCYVIYALLTKIRAIFRKNRGKNLHKSELNLLGHVIPHSRVHFYIWDISVQILFPFYYLFL